MLLLFVSMIKSSRSDETGGPMVPVFLGLSGRETWRERMESFSYDFSVDSERLTM